ALYFVYIRRLGQRKGQQQRRLLRAQVVGYHHAGLVPVIAAHDAAFAHAGALHHHGAALLDDVYELLVEPIGRAGADAGNHDALRAKADHGIGHARTRAGVNVGDLDIGHALNTRKVELAVHGVAPVRRAVVLDLVRIDVAEQPQITRAECLQVVRVGLAHVARGVDL